MKLGLNMACEHTELGADIAEPASYKQLSHSRSTSAGSSRSQGQSSEDLQKSPYPTDALGLPEYDYPTPWSIEEGSQAVGDKYPSALIVKNTFLGTQVNRPSSLQEFFNERGTKSCPASSIGLPPGLEDMVEPEEAAARLAAVEATYLQMAGMTETHYIPSELLDDAQVMDDTGCFAATQQHQPVVLDLMQALSARLGEHLQQTSHMQPEQFLHVQYQCAPPAYSAFAMQGTEPVIGSAECPTVGSQGHRFGACKPCAFMYTKGCGNGVNCSFCHLCEPGEKKRRAKENQAAHRMTSRR